VSGVDTTAPAGVNVGQHFTVTVHATVTQAGATGGTTTFSLSGPADCVLNPAGSQVEPLTNGAVSADWDVVCSGASNHSFTGTVSIQPTFPVHVTDANTANNGPASDPTPVVVSVTAIGNLTTTISGVPAVIETPQSGTSDVTATVTISNSGDPVSVIWTVTFTGSGAIPCTVNSGGNQNDGPETIPPTQVNDYTANLSIPGNAHSCTYTITACADAQFTIHQVGQDCDTFNGELARDVLVDKFVLLVGPAAINLSDTNGRYMWIISEIGNVSNQPELVHINMSIAEPVPAGCTRDIALIIPGAVQFFLAAGEQKTLVWRVRYECHSPATAQVLNQTVTVGVTHCDPTTSLGAPAPEPTTVTPQAPGGLCQPNTQNHDPEHILLNNSKTVLKQVIIQ
jgi:hypothetical protein